MAQKLLYQEFLDSIIALSQKTVGGSEADPTPIITLTKEVNG